MDVFWIKFLCNILDMKWSMSTHCTVLYVHSMKSLSIQTSFPWLDYLFLVWYEFPLCFSLLLSDSSSREKKRRAKKRTVQFSVKLWSGVEWINKSNTSKTMQSTHLRSSATQFNSTERNEIGIGHWTARDCFVLGFFPVQFNSIWYGAIQWQYI